MYRFVLCSRVSAKSGRLLAEAITAKQGKRCFVYFSANLVPQRRSCRKFVRYGNSDGGFADPLNHGDAVELASNKLRALKTMSNAGVNVPKIFDVGGTNNQEFTLVLRKNIRHGGNDNPIIVKPGEAIDHSFCSLPSGYDYAMQWIRKAREFRVHVVRGSIIRVQKKCKKRGVECDSRIRSESRGWVLCDWEDESENLALLGRLKIIAANAVSSLGLDFGAVDIVEERDTGKLFVLEVNTAPGLNEEGARLYAEAIYGGEEHERTI